MSRSGWPTVFFAAMLHPVNKLSDDEATTATPTAKPVMAGSPAKRPAANKPPLKSPPTGSTSTPKKRPAASTASGEGKPPPMKKPAARDRSPKGPKICHYIYKKTGVWGFKIDGKQKLRVTHPQPAQQYHGLFSNSASKQFFSKRFRTKPFLQTFPNKTVLQTFPNNTIFPNISKPNHFSKHFQTEPTKTNQLSKSSSRPR